MKAKGWLGLVGLAIAVLLPEFFIDHDSHVAIGGLGFYAWFGWVVCLLLVFVTLLLGRVIKCKDDYYDD